MVLLKYLGGAFVIVSPGPIIGRHEGSTPVAVAIGGVSEIHLEAQNFLYC